MTQEWTDTALAELDRRDQAGEGAEAIARALGRDPADIAEHLRIVRLRRGRVPEPSFGADEEGDVPPPHPGVDHDAAWVGERR